MPITIDNNNFGNYQNFSTDTVTGATSNTVSQPDQTTVDSLPKGSKDKNSNYLAPDLPTNDNVTTKSLSDFIVATPSPGAAFAVLCIKDSSQQIEQNQKRLLDQADAISKEMNEQADNIKSAALKQMIFSIASATVSAVCGAVSGIKTLKIDSGLEGAALNIAMVAPNSWNIAGKSLSETSNAIGGYLSARDQADNKRIDGQIEQQRAIMEGIRNTMSVQRDLINKSLDFMNSMQSNMNQTRAKILG